VEYAIAWIHRRSFLPEHTSRTKRQHIIQYFYQDSNCYPTMVEPYTFVFSQGKARQIFIAPPRNNLNFQAQGGQTNLYTVYYHDVGAHLICMLFFYSTPVNLAARSTNLQTRSWARKQCMCAGATICF
jgi:hypothetical protein